MPFTDTSMLDDLLEEVKRRPTYAAYLRASRALEQRPTLPNEAMAKLKRLRVAVFSSSTIEPLVAALRVDGHAQGLLLEFHLAAYGRVFEEALEASSALPAFQPDVVLVMMDVEALAPVRHEGTPSVPAMLERLQQLIGGLKGQTRAAVLLSNFIPMDLFPFAVAPDALETAYHELNLALRRAYAADPQMILLDLDGLAAYHGRVRSVDANLRYLAGMLMSESFIPLVSRKILAILSALTGQARKCLVLDLDNTLWGGVLGEVGPEGIALGPDGSGKSYVDVQRAILRLREKGVLLAVNSKNNLEEVRQVLREHPHMVLREEHFASLQVDWSPKPERMRCLAQALRLGLDSFVFVDDDPAERLQMSMALPEVLTVEMPPNPALFPKTLLELSVFEKPAVTDEDRLRGDDYAAERQRDAAREGAHSFEEFLSRLGMVITIRLAEARDVDRIAQLTQRTNQFNVTTRRYQAGEIARLIGDPSYRVYTLRLRDTFGDSGLTGLAIIRVAEGAWVIETLLMSCRIIGRRVETVFLAEVLADAERAGAQEVQGEYIPTPKNGLAREFYANEGFAPVEGGRWSWRLGRAGREKPTWEVRIER